MKLLAQLTSAACLVCLLALPTTSQTASAKRSRPDPGRIRGGLLVLYDFASGAGSIVKDRAGVGEPVDLRIADPRAVRRADGTLQVRAKTVIRAGTPPSRVIQAIRRSGQISIEAWVRPANIKQSGPARIVTLSSNPSNRNFTLGQDGDRFDVRVRTTKTSRNGIPSLSTPRRSLRPKLTHVVYTRDRTGTARVYIDGTLVAQRSVPGAPANWSHSMELALANELSGDRPWLGTYFLVAIYSRSLSARDVRQNFEAGADVAAPTLVKQRNTQRFLTGVAPIFARHCLECHGPGSKKGGLDLSRRDSALAGGASGPSLVPGKSKQSLLWNRVASDDMPKQRPALSAADKTVLREWIDAGADWTLEAIDPAVYAHQQQGHRIWVQRLTVDEYIETVRAAVDVDISNQAGELLPPDVRADGFRNTAYNLNVDLKHVDAYAKLARMIVERMDVEAFTRRYSNSRRLTDKANRDLIAKMGRWLLRGPLEEREIAAYRGIATTVSGTGGDFQEAMSYVIEAMLQSPRFIYRIENQRGDGTRWRVGQYELASRLSYIIWGGPPDEALLEAAGRGTLDRAGSEAHVKRMLDNPRARRRARQFLAQWLNLQRLDNLQPNPQRFPDWQRQLADDMRKETLLFFDEIVWEQNRPLSDLFNAQLTYLTPRLARHYGLQPPGDTADETPVRYDLTSTPQRGGLLTQGSVLTVGGDEASMVSRGLFILHDVLRGVVKDPPPCVDTTPVPTKAGLTQRSIAEARIANRKCGACHARFEPLAFGLEKFDGLGTDHQRDEHGNRLRDDGEILFPGTSKSVPYQSSREMMDLLAESDRVGETLTWKVTQFALGRPPAASEAPIIADIHQQAQDAGGTYANLITAIILSDLVQFIRTEPVTQSPDGRQP